MQPRAAPRQVSHSASPGRGQQQGWAGQALLSFLMTQQPEITIQPSPATARCSLFTLQTGKATLSTARLQIFLSNITEELLWLTLGS